MEDLPILSAKIAVLLRGVSEGDKVSTTVSGKADTKDKGKLNKPLEESKREHAVRAETVRVLREEVGSDAINRLSVSISSGEDVRSSLGPLSPVHRTEVIRCFASNGEVSTRSI